MNVTKRTKDFRLLGIEALFRQIKPFMRKDKRLRQELSNRTAGYYGEKHLDYMLRIYPHNSAHALSAIRLKYKNFDFQLDTVILTNQRHVILETKNWAGELVYDPSLRQLIQLQVDRKVRYPCPIAQVEKQKRNLTGWFLENDLPVLPIETFVVISNASTILSNPQQDQLFTRKVLHVDLLHERLDTLFLPNTRKATPSSSLNKVFHSIQAQSFHRYEDILRKRNITQTQLITGISCEKCWQYPMIRQARNWHCTKCGHADRNAHIQTVYDYFLLNEMKPATNSEIRTFLNAPNRKVTYNLLKNMKLKMSGSRRHTLYHPPPLEQFPQNSSLPVIELHEGL